jgi:hypothetical protein
MLHRAVREGHCDYSNCAAKEEEEEEEVRKCLVGWLSERRAELFLGAARCSLWLVAGGVLLVMHGVVPLLILMLRVLIYRTLHCSLVFWVLILTIWMLAIALRDLRCSFLFIHKASI